MMTHTFEKQFTDLAVQMGRRLQSPQTGYIHYHYHSTLDERQDTIPIYENILFSLALMRSRQVENVQEAKAMLDRLLYFQNTNLDDLKQHGHFPVYLHEFPTCKDRYRGVYLLAPFYWIQSGFQQILGQQLNQRLKSSIIALMNYCLSLLEQPSLPYVIDVKIATAAIAFGQFFQNKQWIDLGEKKLDVLRLDNNRAEWKMPQQIAEILVALQMLYPSIENSPWSMFWKELSLTWHPQLKAYVGPGIREYQWMGQPQTTLHDLFLGSFTGSLSKRVLEPQPFHLQAVLIQVALKTLPENIYPLEKSGTTGTYHWRLFQTSWMALSAIDEADMRNNLSEKGFIPLKMLWEEAGEVHSFICQGGSSCKLVIHYLSETLIDLEMQLGANYELDDKEKQREIIFYFDLDSKGRLIVDGLKANTFRLDQDVRIAFPNHSMKFSFQLEEGNGEWMGHFMPGNRPSQLAVKGERKFNAYDSQIFLRLLRRSSTCRLHVRIDIIKIK